MSTIITDNPYTFTVQDNMNINAVFEDIIPITIITNGNNAYNFYIMNKAGSVYTWSIPNSSGTYKYSGTVSGFELDNISTVYRSKDTKPSVANNSWTTMDLSGLSITYLPQYAFMFCNQLDTVKLPATLVNLYAHSLENMYRVKTLYCYAEVPPTCGTDALKNLASTWQQSGLHIYVPSGSVNAYKSASGWSAYSSKIYSMP